MNRRNFISRSAVIGSAALLAPRWLYSGDAGKRLNLAVVGAAGKGDSDTGGIAKDHNVVALCDVDSKRLEGAVKKQMDRLKDVPSPITPKTFTDFRKMIDTMEKEIDGVIVSTPDHTHFVAARWAMGHKKHVCVQKPLCNTIWEARELLRLAKEAGVVTQMGNQGRTMEGQRQVKEWIEQGAIGNLKEIRLWTNRPIWPQGDMARVAATCPENLNWDLWLAQEKSIPYFEYEVGKEKDGKPKLKSVHPFSWRGWWDYGSGALGDMGCHIMDCTFNVLGRRVPEKIEVESSKVTDLCAPAWSSLVYHMAASDKYPAMKVTWNDGSKDGKPNKPERDPRMPQDIFDKATSGMMFIGSDGVIADSEAYCGNPKIYPEPVAESAKKKTFNKTEKRSPKPGNPQLEWAHCIANSETPSSVFDYSVPLTEFVALGNLAVRSGQTIQWDTVAMKVTNVESANKFVKRQAYREGW